MNNRPRALARRNQRSTIADRRAGQASAATGEGSDQGSTCHPEVSVVVASYNAASTLPACIESILEQTYEPLELVVVDDGSNDQTPTLLRSHPDRNRFLHLELSNGGPSRARNVGACHTHAPLLAFFDADCRIHPRCVEELVESLVSSGAASIGGAQLPPVDASPFGLRVQRFFEALGFVSGYVQSAQGGGVRETSHNPSCNVLYRRAVFAELGGFDETLWPGEDVDLDRRATTSGYRHLFNPSAVVYHYRPSDLGAFRRMMTSYGRAQMGLLRRHGLFRAPQAVPLAVALGVVVTTLSILQWPLLTSLVALLAACCLLGVAEAQRRRAGADRSFYRLLFVGSMAWLGGFYRELLRPSFPKAPKFRSPSELEGAA